MIRYLVTWLSVAGAFLVIDAIWLGFVARDFYRRNLEALLAEPFRMHAAAAFYVLYTIGVMVFAVVPAVKTGSPWQAILLGAFFGLCAYGTYDLTNLATIKNWPVVVSLVDMAWGAFLTASSAFAGYLVLSRFGQ